jgi:hypothetical protein
MYTYNKKHWPYQFRMLPKLDAWEQMCQLEAYCYEHFKSGNWRNNGLYFAFKRESDAALFVLRWNCEGS